MTAPNLARDDADFARADLSILARPGLVVVDRSLNLVASNSEAIQILTFPSSPEKIPNLEGWLAKRIRSGLVDRRSSVSLSFVEQFKSAKRTYYCRSFPMSLNGNADVPNHPAIVLLLERTTNGAVKLAEICTRFGLTPRELETVKLLFEGLTSKEIADRMKISPNTVKAFLRLVMVKMGVSTRSGIVGKIAGSKPPSAQPTFGRNSW
ncbi:MAG: LuxR C-terminal-related transcriptional regulator [Terriglobales bacterium]|jgi:DNA-binding CsgD family transcriptional regulator